MPQTRRVSLIELRRLIRSIISEEAWVPGRFYPALEPMSGRDASRLNVAGGMYDDVEGFDDLDEVDTDPANNPGRPEDPYDYLGMHPDPKAAMAHPSASGGGGGEADPSKPPDEPDVDT